MPLTGKRHEPGSFARLPLFPAAMKLFLRRACVTRPPWKLFLTDGNAAPVFAIGLLERLASVSCVRSFRPVLHEAATRAAPARTVLWSPNLQPRPPLPHICVLTAEDILVEHSCNTQQARAAATGTALRFRSAAPLRRARTLQDCGVSTLAHHTTYRRV